MVTCGVVPAVVQPVLAGVSSKPGLINWFRPPIPGPTPPVTVSQIVLPFNDRFPVTPGGRISAGAVKVPPLMELNCRIGKVLPTLKPAGRPEMEKVSRLSFAGQVSEFTTMRSEERRVGKECR